VTPLPRNSNELPLPTSYIASFKSINRGSREAEGPDYESIRASLETIVHDRLHSDQGSNYMSYRFQEFLQSKSMSHAASPAYTKAINGVAERRTGMVTNMMRYIINCTCFFSPTRLTACVNTRWVNPPSQGKDTFSPKQLALRKAYTCRQRVRVTQQHAPIAAPLTT